jgi:chemotaxis protein histidine kinase CheA
MTPDEIQDTTTVDYDNVDFGDFEDQSADNLEVQEEAIGDDENAFEEYPEDEAETEDAPEEGEAEEVEAEAEDSDEDAVTVTLSSGETLTLDEVEKGMMLQADYTRKTTEVAEQRKALEESTARAGEHERSLAQSLQAAQSFIQKLIPPKPSFALAQSNPAAYQSELALHEQAMEMLQRVQQAQSQAQTQQQQRQEAEMSQLLAAEQERLVQAMPHLGNPKRMEAFMADVSGFAKELGFSEQEIATTGDHRVLQMVHLAKIGKRAQENAKNAQRRVNAKPKPKAAKAKAATDGRANAAAMRRLQKTGSLNDALNVDIAWD